jgi:hypothetical protein
LGAKADVLPGLEVTGDEVSCAIEQETRMGTVGDVAAFVRRARETDAAISIQTCPRRRHTPFLLQCVSGWPSKAPGEPSDRLLSANRCFDRSEQAGGVFVQAAVLIGDQIRDRSA